MWRARQPAGRPAAIFETFVKPGGCVAAAHVHPHQEERFAILAGSVGFRLGREERVAGPGERLTVPAGTSHRFWNAGEEETHFLCAVRPALQFEQLIETIFALAAGGKTNRTGLPNPLCLAVIADATFDTVRLPFPPAWMQRLGLAMLAPLGWLLGYRPVYASAAPAHRVPVAGGSSRPRRSPVTSVILIAVLLGPGAGFALTVRPPMVRRPTCPERAGRRRAPSSRS